ncbi:alpha/beta hydrolase family protein [Elizabethkingia bruuniana]|uniref:alpha/beta hydrolase family protein n=1 Tax=Elizabethkingia bruuniana TaxID=1756149 RepID=UPI0013F6206C|nr:prolyl oligopeptidase family serine peptidase [Elizabethkingia bruuniana]
MKLILILFLLTGAYYGGQVLNDSLKNWMSKFYTLYFQEFSDNGKYVAIKKRYENNSDTLMIFNTETKIALIGITTKAAITKFFKEDYIMASKGSDAELWNLSTNQKTHYGNVKRVIVLPHNNQFLIWDNLKGLSWYATNNKLLQKYNDVDLVIDDKKGKFWYVKKNENTTELWDTSGLLYSTDKSIFKVELSKSGKRLIVYKNDKSHKIQGIEFINLKNKKIEPINTFSVPESEHLDVEELADGSAYLITSLNSIKPDKHISVDIWYGNDNNLEDKFQSRSEYQYWVWKPESGMPNKILNNKKSKVIQIGSERYFLMYTPNESKDYTIDYAGSGSILSIYDTKDSGFQFLGKLPVFTGNGRENGGVFSTFLPQICTSIHGDYIIYKTGQKGWELFYLPSRTKYYITGKDLENPIFSSDNRYVFFEGKYDLWKYDIEKSKLAKMQISETKNVRVVNFEHKTFSSAGSVDFYSNTVDLNKALLLKIWDRDQNSDISYVLWKGRLKESIINPSPDLIQYFKFNTSFTKYAYLKENYNRPTEVVFKNLGKDSKVLFSISDKVAWGIKQEIVNYKSPIGENLQGTLYYPLNFKPDKKYPMVVYIYRLLRRYSNGYKIPKVEDLNVRTLIKRGYFVYLPDIEYDSSGPGLSALNCVNRSLDAVKHINNIDLSKVGLSGFSMGGYETSFIATKSNRFATYIAGAGSSDLVRAFYSFSYGFISPLYWRYENNIYEMKVPFAQNKDLYIQNSPIYNVENVNAPILLWAGKNDDNVPADEVMEFYIGLKRYKKSVIALFYPDQKHSFTGKAFEDYFTRSLEWWDYFLKNKKYVTWINKEMQKPD